MNKRALISVSDKEGLVPFVQELTNLGFEIISTGGTKTALEQAGLQPIGIEAVTEFPEMMDGSQDATSTGAWWSVRTA